MVTRSRLCVIRVISFILQFSEIVFYNIRFFSVCQLRIFQFIPGIVSPASLVYGFRLRILTSRPKLRILVVFCRSHCPFSSRAGVQQARSSISACGNGRSVADNCLEKLHRSNVLEIDFYISRLVLVPLKKTTAKVPPVAGRADQQKEPQPEELRFSQSCRAHASARNKE